MRGLFVAYVAAGIAVVALARALAKPFSESIGYRDLAELADVGGGIRPMMGLPSWPDHLVVEPGVSLGAFLWLGGLLVIGGVMGLLVDHPPRRRGIAALVIGAAGVLLPGIAALIAVPWDPGPAFAGQEWVLTEPPSPLDMYGLPVIGMPIGTVIFTSAMLVVAGLIVIFAGPPIVAAPRGRRVLAAVTFALAVVIAARAAVPAGIFMMITAVIGLAIVAALLVGAFFLPLWLWARRRARAGV